MKHLRYVALFVAIVSIINPFIASSQPTQSNSLQKGYYVVVAAFWAKRDVYAQKYADQLNAAGRHAKVGLDATRNLNLVYLDYFTDFNESVAKMTEVRKESGFGETWIRIIKDEAIPSEPVVAAEPIQKIPEKVVEKKVEPKPVERVTVPVETKPAPVEIKKEEPIKPTVLETEVVPNPKAAPVYLPQTLKNTQVFFSLYNARNGEILDGEVEVIDTDRSRLISKMKANTYLTLPDPNSKSGKLTLIGSAFGYRKIQHEMNYNNTESDTLKDEVALVGNYYMVKFDLSHMVRGDISTLYNVYFYNDAAVMLADSKFELNKLLQMMKDNPNYKIMLHGHTNGGGRGKIIHVGPSRDFFNITKDDVVQESGTAKELSGARALTIKEWLVSQGIDQKRIETKAWGGARMLHDKDSQHARRNVRVEVEVLEN